MAEAIPVRPEVHESDRNRIQVGDTVPVNTRVGWGAIFAGAVVALTVYLILTLLGGAIGFTISDDVRSGTLTTSAAIWAVLTTVVALFLGGWITSRCTVGENTMEAVVHGVIMYGVVMFLILWLVSTGMRAGFNAMWGVASFTNSAAQNVGVADWEAFARRNGVPQETINQWKQSMQTATGDVASTVQDPENRQAAAEYATQATWYTLLGTLLSMAAAVGGAVVGAGPTLRTATPTRSVLTGQRTVHST